MTTIVYHHESKTIAYDSRTTDGGIIMSDDTEKKFTKGDLKFFLAGSLCDMSEFIDAYPIGAVSAESEIAGFMVDSGIAYGLSIRDNKIIKWELKYNDAMGSGHKYALTAMDYGKTAVEAIEAAIKRCVYTGGKVREFKIEGNND
jgi:ATP-dependent protease HslVU (ClpYQ) peptidase subunit